VGVVAPGEKKMSFHPTHFLQEATINTENVLVRHIPPEKMIDMLLFRRLTQGATLL